MKKFDLKNLQGSKRTLRSGSYATVLAVVVLAFVILVNLVVQALPSKWTEFDISTSSLFTLSDTSKNLLHEPPPRPASAICRSSRRCTRI